MYQIADYRDYTTNTQIITRAIQGANPRNARRVVVEQLPPTPLGKWNPSVTLMPSTIKVTYAENIASVLGESNMPILYSFMDHLKGICLNDPVEVSGMAVTVFDNPEGNEQVVFSIDVNVEAEVALPFWDRIGSNTEQWLLTQHDSTRRVVREQFAIDVCWQRNSI